MSWGCLLLGGAFVLYPLSCSWTYLTNYSFGWWVPLLTLVLLWERWPRRPAPQPPVRSWLLPAMLVWTLLFFCLRPALEVSPVARPLDLACALLYVGALLYWVWVYGGTAWLRHFAFPLCFLLLSVPWPRQIEDPLVQGLAPINASLVAGLLPNFGILAHATGQVIVLPTCTLGVEEACSGLRSIQAALMIAFLLGELYRFGWIRRLQIVAIALVLALLGNIMRTLFLCLVANASGVHEMEEWHDAAGASILVFTSLSTFLICYLFQRQQPKSPAIQPKDSTGSILPNFAGAQRFALVFLVVVLVAEGVTQGWFAWRESSLPLLSTWKANLPTHDQAKEVKIADQTQDILKYDSGKQVNWVDQQGWKWTAFWFLYHQKPWAVSAFTNHNPDKCLPAVGYLKISDHPVINTEVGGIPLAIYPKEYSWQGSPVYVFWLVYANRSNFPLEHAVNPPNDGAVAKLRFLLSSIWNGRRGSTSETESLETILLGPADYATARAAYLTELEKIIIPEDKITPASGQPEKEKV